MKSTAATPTSLSGNAGLRWAVFISGFGSNLQAILDAHPKINVELVVSSSDKAFGLERAQRKNISTLVTPLISNSKKINWEQLHQELLIHKIDRIFLAGFMKIIPASFIQLWKDRMLNLHPSLLPDFPGLNAIEKSFEAGGAMGATVHIVTEELDGGPILVQRVAINEKDRANLSLEEAKKRIHELEHQLTVEAIYSIDRNDK